MNTLLFQHQRPYLSPLGREFAAYIQDQFAGRTAAPLLQTNAEEDPMQFDEPIIVRAFFYRMMRKAFFRDSTAVAPDGRDSDLVSTATTHRWATLDARDFRLLNSIERNLCLHCAAIICANESPRYQLAMQTQAPDVLDEAHAVVRANRTQRQPQLPSVPAEQETLPLPQTNTRPAERLVSTSHFCRR